MEKKDSLEKIFQAFFKYPYQPLIDMDRLMEQPIKALKEFLNKEIVAEIKRMEESKGKESAPFGEAAKKEYIDAVQKAIKDSKKSHKRCNFKACRKKVKVKHHGV